MAFVKDPEAVRDYTWDWTAWLDGDTIASATVTVPQGLTKDSETNTDTLVVVWISGGDPGVDYTLTCQVVTAQGRTDERSITIRVRER